jgi:hypothetical protein
VPERRVHCYKDCVIWRKKVHVRLFGLFCRANAQLQPRRLIISPAAVGCKLMLGGRSPFATLERPTIQIGGEVACLVAVRARSNLFDRGLIEAPRLPTAVTIDDREVALNNVGFGRKAVVSRQKFLRRDYDEVKLACLELVES